jgi:hypothetical protein
MMLMFLFACTPEVEESKPPAESEPVVDSVDSEPPSPPDGAVQGSLSLSDGKTSSQTAWHSFTFANDKGAMVYFSSNPDATCDNLTATLFQQADPSPLYMAGECNLLIVIPDTLPLSFDFSGVTTASFQLFCPLGSGAFAQTNGSWRWSGEWYVGTADAGQVDLSRANDTVIGTVSLETFSGSYPYIQGTPTALATGPLSGSVVPELCEGLGSHPVFQ